MKLLRLIGTMWAELFLAVWPFVYAFLTGAFVVDVVRGKYPLWGAVGVGILYVLGWSFLLRGYTDGRRIKREHRRRRANHPGGTSGGPRPLARSRRSGARGGDGPGVAPDAGVPIVGFRAWNIIVVNDQIRLTSLTRGVQWPPGVRMESRCLNPHTGDGGTEALPGPAEGCSCGIYAGKDPEVMPALVVGWVSLWGKVIEHEHGYRSQFAYPKKLILVDSFVTAKLGFPGGAFISQRQPQEIADVLQAAYGVSVEVLALGAGITEVDAQ